jgi:hypothetical protein
MSEATQTEVVVTKSRGRPKGSTKKKIVAVTRRKEWDVKHFISISDAMGKRVTEVKNETTALRSDLYQRLARVEDSLALANDHIHIMARYIDKLENK